MLENEEINLCCCPDENIKHDESLKFQLMVNDANGYDSVIFDNLPKGDLEDLSTNR